MNHTVNCAISVPFEGTFPRIFETCQNFDVLNNRCLNASEAVITSTVMDSYIPLLMLFAIGIGLSGGFVLLSHFIGTKKPTPEKMGPYECGLDPIGTPRQRFSVKFYLVAMLFILFDIEQNKKHSDQVELHRKTLSGCTNGV